MDDQDIRLRDQIAIAAMQAMIGQWQPFISNNQTITSMTTETGIIPSTSYT